MKILKKSFISHEVMKKSKIFSHARARVIHEGTARFFYKIFFLLFRDFVTDSAKIIILSTFY